MKNFVLAIGGFHLCLAVFAQPGPGNASQDMVGRDSDRRTELRSVLRQQRDQQEQRQLHKSLSPEERQELRQQLFEQRRPLHNNKKEPRS